MDGPSNQDTSSESVHKLLETTLLDTERIQRKGRKAGEQSAAIKAFQESSEMTSPIETTTQQMRVQQPFVTTSVNMPFSSDRQISQPSCFPNSGLSQVTLTQSIPNSIVSNTQFQTDSSANLNFGVLAQQGVSQVSHIQCTDNFSPACASTYVLSQPPIAPMSQLDRIEQDNREMKYILRDLTQTLKDIRDKLNPTPSYTTPYYGFNHYSCGMVSNTSHNIAGSSYNNFGNPLNAVNPLSAVSRPFSQALPGVFQNPPPGLSNTVNTQLPELRNQSPVPQIQPLPVSYENQPQTFVDNMVPNMGSYAQQPQQSSYPQHSYAQQP